jgi:hypothetical protein
MFDYNVTLLMSHENQIICGKIIGRGDHGPFVGTITATAWRNLNVSLGTCPYNCSLE